MSEVLEFVGFSCFAAFLYFVWPPLAFIPAGIFFILAGISLDGVRILPKMKRRKAGNESN